MTEKQARAAEAYERNKARKEILGEAYYNVEDKKERRKAYLREYSRKWREQHPDYHDKYRKTKNKRDKDNPITSIGQREYMRRWRERHPDYFRKYRMEQRRKAKEVLDTQQQEDKRHRVEKKRKELPVCVRSTLEALQRIKDRKVAENGRV